MYEDGIAHSPSLYLKTKFQGKMDVKCLLFALKDLRNL